MDSRFHTFAVLVHRWHHPWRPLALLASFRYIDWHLMSFRLLLHCPTLWPMHVRLTPTRQQHVPLCCHIKLPTASMKADAKWPIADVKLSTTVAKLPTCVVTLCPIAREVAYIGCKNVYRFTYHYSKLSTTAVKLSIASTKLSTVIVKLPINKLKLPTTA
jgi:hypothetical protein